MKQIRRQFTWILLTMLVLVVLWEFWFEDLFGKNVLGFNRKIEDFSERLEYVLTVMSFSVLSLLYPFFKAAHAEKARRKIEADREQCIADLNDSIAEIKTLRGIIPICCYCKKIRDDEAIWTQLEAYLEEHSDANFTHGICPECAEKILQEMDLKGSPT